MRSWLWVVLVGACSIQDHLVACPDDGLLCAVGDVCDAYHHICITPEQGTACVGVADGAPCTAGAVHGLCDHDICLPPGCGNRVVDPSEACDDGNQVSGDGCNSLCTSTETCGNGIVDSAIGETCDDGNALSHDGCDSACQPETDQWSIEGIAPTSGRQGWAAYDPIRHQIVFVTDSATWVWEQARWTSRSFSSPPASDGYHQLIWVKTLGAIVDLEGKGSIDHAYTWDGTAWTPRPIDTGPGALSFAAAADPVTNDVVVVTDSTGVWELDLMSGKWGRDVGAPTINWSNGGGIAVDTKRDVLVVVSEGPTQKIYEKAGATWTTFSPSFQVTDGSSVVYDARRQLVDIIGGGNAGSASTIVEGWNGSTLVNLPPLPLARRDCVVVADTNVNDIEVLGCGTAWNDVAFELADAWSTLDRQSPPPNTTNAGYAYDIKHDRLVMFGGSAGFNTNATWVYDGSWHNRTNAAMPLVSNPGFAYDPIRDATIFTSLNQGTWAFRGDTWTMLEPAATGAGISTSALIFDPTRQGIVAVQGNGATYILPSAFDQWSMLTMSGASGGLLSSIAFDARLGVIVLADAALGRVYELSGTTWTPTLSPSISPRVSTNARRGSIEFLTTAVGGSWERIAGTWRQQASPPPALVTIQAAVSVPSGELLVIGNYNQARVLARRLASSASSAQTCGVANLDDDGDGLAACTDPDCWSTCTPACPPYASCP